MLNRRIETFLGCAAEYKDAKAVVFGAPFDSTTSFRPGARFAPRVMRAESWGLETFSPYQNRDMEEIAVFDAGELELCYGNAQKSLSVIEDFTADILTDGKIPFMVGGEHLVTLGAVRAAAKKYPDLHIIHLDAHADLRNDYLGEPLSHACVMRRVWELVGDGRIFQFSIRSGERAEFDFARRHTVLRAFDFEGLGDVICQLNKKPVYFTLDLDVLDPSVFPGTGTPEPGGVGFDALLRAACAISGLNIVACDVCELSPDYDRSGASTAAACKIMREMLLAIR